MNNRSILFCLVTAIGGCSSAPNHSIATSEFQRGCSADSDCVPVYEGMLSCCGACPNAAVNQVGYDAYQSAVSTRAPSCNPEPPCAALSCSAQAACSNGTCQICPRTCPATAAGAIVVVTTTPAMDVNGVQATLAGPASGTMSCEPNPSGALCRWPAGVAVVAGSYSLEVSAPGYQPTTVQVEVSISPPSCGCTEGSIQPSSVVLSPVDGG